MERDNDRQDTLLARREKLEREMREALHLYGPEERTSRHRRVARLARELQQKIKVPRWNLDSPPRSTSGA